MAITDPNVGKLDFLTQSFVGGEALTAYKAVGFNSTDKTKVELVTTKGDPAIGVTLFDSDDGRPCTVAQLGRLEVELGGTLSAGAAVTADTDGQVVAAATGDHIFGVLATGGDAGDRAMMDRVFGISISGAEALLDDVDATADELNYLADVVAGTSAADKAVVLDSAGTIDAIDIDALSIGGTAVTKTGAELNLMVAGVAAGYKLARGVGAVTGTLTVVTGLATVVAVIATAQSDLDGDALAGVSATIGDQAGTPAAGSIIVKAWKITADGDITMIAATDAADINWVAIGT